MEINTHYDERNKIKSICIAGDMDSKEEVEKFLHVLAYPEAIKISITFLNASILHADVVERLDYLQKSVKCRIYTFKRYLYHYLYSLGINCEYTCVKTGTHNRYRTGMEECIETGPSNNDIPKFLSKIHEQYGYDYSQYQLDSIFRRIKICMLRNNIQDFKEFEAIVLRDIEAFEQLFLDFSINTTEFFRDPSVFMLLRSRILPYIGSHPFIKIWCAGCSNGKEVYSLAILLDELGLLEKSQIYATDINPYIVEEAKNGLYPSADIDLDISNYKNSGGLRSFVGYFDLKSSYIKVKKHLQKNILFFQHSLVTNGIVNEFHLILCRNVLIYFNLELQKKVLETFSKSLDKTGFLVLGKSEGMHLNGGYSHFVNYMEKEKVFRLKQQLY